MRRFIASGLLVGLVAAAAVGLSTAEAASPSYISVNPTSKAFGDVTVGSSASQVLTLTNIGGRQTGILYSSISGSDARAPEYKLVSDTCSGRRLRPGDSCSVTVVFAPTVLGIAYAQVNVTADNPPGGVFPQLSGTGIPTV